MEPEMRGGEDQDKPDAAAASSRGGGLGAFTLGFFRTEAGAGVLLALTALAAVVLANSPASAAYFAFVERPFTIRIGAFDHTESVLEWTKEGLMTLFFFIVGLEIKCETLYSKHR